MKNFKITYKRENGSIDTEIVMCKSEKLNKNIQNYYFYINAEIISIDEQL